MDKTIKKVLIAGEPCSGKSSVVRGLKERAMGNAPISFVDESASTLLAIDTAYSEYQPYFQLGVTALQLMAERAAAKSLERQGGGVMICDRGHPDILVYNEDPEECFAALKAKTADELFTCYDLIIYLESVDQVDYFQGNALRSEKSEEQQNRIKTRTRSAYENTYGVKKINIQPMDQVEQKIAKVCHELNEYFGEVIFKED